jgi:Tol biopolymer transport system component
MRLVALIHPLLYAFGRAAPLAAQPALHETSLGYRQAGADYYTVEISATLRLAYVVSTPAGEAVVVDGVRSPWYTEIVRSRFYGDGPHPIQFSPDGARYFYVARQGDSRFAVVDGVAGPAFEYVDRRSPFSPDSRHVAYVARRAGKRFVVRDGVTAPANDQVYELQWSSDGNHVVYIAARAGRKFAVVDDSIIGEGSDIWSLIVSDSGGHVAYTERRSSGQVMVVDGVAGKPYRELAPQGRFSRDGRRFVYAARDTMDYVVVDGVESRAYRQILPGSYGFSADGKHVAFAAADEGAQFWVLDGKEQTHFDGVTVNAQPPFSPDGARLVYTARRGNAWFVVVGERESGPYDRVVHPPRYAPNGQVAYVATQAGRSVVGIDTATLDFEAVGELYPLRRSIAMTVRRSGNWHLIVDGVASAPYPEQMCCVAGSDDGRRTSFHTNHRAGQHLHVVDGVEERAYDELRPLRFSPDGRHYAYAARRDSQWLIVLDGQELGAYTMVLGAFPYYGQLSNDSYTVLAQRDGEDIRVSLPWPK